MPGAPYRPKSTFRGTPGLSRADLPPSVDWRGTGADPGVKDQVCVWGGGGGGGKVRTICGLREGGAIIWRLPLCRTYTRHV